MGLVSFMDIDFCYEILLYLVSLYYSIFSNLLNQNLHKVKAQKRKLESFVKRYSFKFWALQSYILYLYILYVVHCIITSAECIKISQKTI